MTTICQDWVKGEEEVDEVGEVEELVEINEGGEGGESRGRMMRKLGFAGSPQGGRLEQLLAEQTLQWRFPQLQLSIMIGGGFKPGQGGALGKKEE